MQQYSPLDVLKQFGITAQENKDFVVIGENLRDKVFDALGAAFAQTIDYPRWVVSATHSSDIGAPAAAEPKQWVLRASRV